MSAQGPQCARAPFVMADSNNRRDRKGYECQSNNTTLGDIVKKSGAIRHSAIMILQELYFNANQLAVHGKKRRTAIDAIATA